nr:serine protease nudel-like [Macaca nemestrina]
MVKLKPEPRPMDPLPGTFQYFSSSSEYLPHQQCTTASQQLGFLCKDLSTCLPPSQLCNGKLDCSQGEDESATYCGQMPNRVSPIKLDIQVSQPEDLDIYGQGV